jgi:hypothetical protein
MLENGVFLTRHLASRQAATLASHLGKMWGLHPETEATVYFSAHYTPKVNRPGGR